MKCLPPFNIKGTQEPARDTQPVGAVTKGGQGESQADYSGFQKVMRQLVMANQVAARGPDDPSVAGHLLRARDAAGKPLSDEQLVCEFGVMFQGGHDTTARTMAWALCVPQSRISSRSVLPLHLLACSLTDAACLPVMFSPSAGMPAESLQHDYKSAPTSCMQLT